MNYDDPFEVLNAPGVPAFGGCGFLLQKPIHNERMIVWANRIDHRYEVTVRICGEVRPITKVVFGSANEAAEYYLKWKAAVPALADALFGWMS